MVAYPFVAKHRTDFQIVTEQGHSLRGHKALNSDSASNMGEAVIMPVESPSRPSTHTSTSTSSRFGATTSTYEETDSVTGEDDFISTSEACMNMDISGVCTGDLSLLKLKVRRKGKTNVFHK